MDYDLSTEQSDLLAAVDSAVGDVERAQAIARDSGYDSKLDERLETGVTLAGRTLLDRVLVADRLAELGTATTFGTRAVLSQLGELPSGPVTVVDRNRSRIGRYADRASTVVVLDGGSAEVFTLSDAQREPVRSGLGFSCGRVDVDALTGGTALPGPADSIARLAAAAEIAGNAASGMAWLANHLQTREQFGQPLSSFQALRHRTAELAVRAEATRWMVRQAADAGDPRGIDLSAAYAASSAALLTTELLQLAGARGFAKSFGLSTFAMRLDGLRVELGGEDRLAAAVLSH
jgi:hypothetical protein